MTLNDRDRRVVVAVNKFGQLTAAHIDALIFDANATRTPCDRSIKRLLASGHLARVELRRLVGGSRGGAGQYVYQLGRRGFGMFNDGSWKPNRSVKYHQLLLADSYLSVKQLAAAGHLVIDGWATGDETVVEVGGIELRPDMRLDVHKNGDKRVLWLEVDMATEGKRQINDKLARYWQAVNQLDEAEWPVMPRVIWVACDDERARELRWIIDQGKDEEARRYFVVTTLPEFPQLLVNRGQTVGA